MKQTRARERGRARAGQADGAHRLGVGALNEGRGKARNLRLTRGTSDEDGAHGDTRSEGRLGALVRPVHEGRRAENRF